MADEKTKKRKRESAKLRRLNYPEKERRRRYTNQLKIKYGLLLVDYMNFYEKQGGNCLICKKHYPFNFDGNGTNKLQVDHCHTTGKVRGLLCVSCNTFVGNMEKHKSKIRIICDYLGITL